MLSAYVVITTNQKRLLDEVKPHFISFSNKAAQYYKIMNDDFFDMKPKDNSSNQEILKPDVIEMPNGGKVLPKNGGQIQPIDKKGKIVEAFTDKENFGKILNLAGEILDIQKIKVLTKKQVQELEQQRKNLEVETDSYVRKIREETNGQLDKARTIQRMMETFYKYNDGSLTGEQFQSIVCTLIDKLFSGGSNTTNM